jgi:hypothetical protein
MLSLLRTKYELVVPWGWLACELVAWLKDFLGCCCLLLALWCFGSLVGSWHKVVVVAASKQFADVMMLDFAYASDLIDNRRQPSQTSQTAREPAGNEQRDNRNHQAALNQLDEQYFPLPAHPHRRAPAPKFRVREFSYEP